MNLCQCTGPGTETQILVTAPSVKKKFRERFRTVAKL